VKTRAFKSKIKFRFELYLKSCNNVPCIIWIDGMGWSEEVINENFGFMKTLTNRDKFKEYIKTSHFWADAWTINTLEYKLNFKFIILSEESYLEDAHDSVLNCGDSNPHIAKLGVATYKKLYIYNYTSNELIIHYYY
jgi:hypothetical protein